MSLVYNPTGLPLTYNADGSPLRANTEYGPLLNEYVAKSGANAQQAGAMNGWYMGVEGLFDNITAHYPLIGADIAAKTYNAVNAGDYANSLRAKVAGMTSVTNGLQMPQGAFNKSRTFDTQIPVFDVVNTLSQGITFYIKDNIAGAGDHLIGALGADGNLRNYFTYHATSSGTNTDTLSVASAAANTPSSRYAPGMITMWGSLEGDTQYVYYRVNGVTTKVATSGTYEQDVLYFGYWPTIAFVSRANTAYTLRMVTHFQGLSEAEIIRLEKANEKLLKSLGRW